MFVDAELLRRHDACEDELDIFCHHWPEGVKLTRAVCRRAAVLQLDLEWAAGNLLEEPGDEVFWERADDAWQRYKARARDACPVASLEDFHNALGDAFYEAVKVIEKEN